MVPEICLISIHRLLLDLCLLIVSSRDAFLKNSFPLVSGLIGAGKTGIIPLNDAIDLIEKHTPDIFLDGVRSAGGRPLYRGESEAGCAILRPEPDLLLPDTYSDAEALTYFRELETFLTDLENVADKDGRKNVPRTLVAKPSTGHIATPSLEEAGNWGTPMTVWPIGKELSFVYPTRRKLFYDSSIPTSSLRKDDYQVNSNLKEGLLGEKEILFATRDAFGLVSSAFLVVPDAYSRKLLSALNLL